MNRYYYASCQPGSEKALKAEWESLTEKKATFSFSRPGFVTFKYKENEELPAALDSIYARAQGLFLGKCIIDPLTGGPELDQLVTNLKNRPDPFHFQLWARDRWLPDEEPPKSDTAKWLEPFSKLAYLGQSFNQAQPGQVQILDGIVVDPGQLWLGKRMLRRRGDLALPGEKWNEKFPDDVPSRAYLKIKEALSRSGIQPKPGEWVAELGSSPGGACYALLEKGLYVVGIDPAAMDERLFKKFPDHFFHIPMTAQKTYTNQFPEIFQKRLQFGQGLDWLVSDMHIDAREAIEIVGQWIFENEAQLKGVIMTLKLKTWDQAEFVPRLVERFKSFGLLKVQARQLSTNRQEITLTGLTRKGSVLVP